jgi:molybdopterin synthase catalytic subunit
VSFLSDAPLELGALVASVQSPERGGVASFVGVVRDHHDGRRVMRLDYLAYGPMAEAECARIVSETEARWPVVVSLRHRVGSLEIGESAIVAVAASAHREAAFEACRYVVEEVKRRVPIWKREYYADGTVAWVGPTQIGRPMPVGSA